MVKGRQKTDYTQEVKKLKSDGPDRLYLLCGEEDYLRERFLEQLRAICVGEKGGEFNYHRLSGVKLELSELSEAVDSMPFFSDRTLIEVRDFDVGEYRDEAADKLSAILSDIPDYATVALVSSVGNEPDGRLSLTKSIKKSGSFIEFTSQSASALNNWITRHFASRGKAVSPAVCERLVFFSGDLMTGLLPEIDKIASYVSGDEVTMADVEKLAHRIPEAQTFDLTDRLSEKNYDGAAAVLSELMRSGEHPIKTLAIIGGHMRKLYAARTVLDSGGGREECMKLVGTTSAFYADRMLRSAAGFTKERLGSILVLCCETDYRMKSSREEDDALLTELLLRMAVA